MKQKINKKELDRATRGILDMKPKEHIKPKDPTKKELNKKFVMRLDRKGKPTIKEVN